MKKNSLILFLLSCIIFISCEKKQSDFPIENKYWTVEDYQNVVREIRFSENSDHRVLPTFDDPELKIVIEKLTDQENFKIVLEDKELGLKHRNEVAQGFFDVWNDMNELYSVRDKTDKFVYENEMIAVYNFGLGLQLNYFKLGNEELAADSDDPNSSNVQNMILMNQNTLVRNYSFYLDEINNESAYSENGISKIADGIDTYFTELVTNNPKADYTEMLDKITLLQKKAKSERIKKSLSNLSTLINSKKVKEV